jgi:aspartate/methionine/tyrosine aminotransferase
MNYNTDPLEYFRLKPIKAARVSEISEMTASSGIPPEAKVNFHIGNPVQDPELSSAYLRMALGLDIKRVDLEEGDIAKLIEELGWDQTDILIPEFLLALIKKSAPYMPRGGYHSKKPNYLINYFNDWLTKNQQEPLSYDLGETSGRREIILASGGIFEALRLLFHSLSSYLVHLPSKILYYGIDLPVHLTNYNGLLFEQLPSEEIKLIDSLERLAAESVDGPIFLILGKNTSEDTRRGLRKLSLSLPVFFIEVNDAPNHQSLAREAKMMNRVIRFITPGVFSTGLKNLSTIFIAGNSAFIKIIETIQFQLKGTPSASEIELLSFILKEKLFDAADRNNPREIIVKSAPEHDSFHVPGFNSFFSHAEKWENKISSLVEDKNTWPENLSAKITAQGKRLTSNQENISRFPSYDFFFNTNTKELLYEFIKNISDDEWNSRLIKSFLHSFLRHHPEYRIQNCFLVSGSSRTGLGLLGFHCGIKEVIIPDLSWTYEHCFPSVSTIPLTDDLEIDIDGMKKAVEEKLRHYPAWTNYGAVALNNPHNATGREFNSEKLKSLIKWLLERNIFIIDDLSYQNVAPSDSLKEIKTVRQLTDDIFSNGYISSDQADHLITIHSLSKTDSFAGARLSVIEIRNEIILNKFSKINSTISPNIAAVFLAYLFYRNTNETVNAYWRLRNRIFLERMRSLEEAVKILPEERNNFKIEIKAPTGSMYPLMIINNLPGGLSLDWLASGLALQGIGLVPLATFARTEKGFETARKTFRLTLGGTDNTATLLVKTRRVLIDLNRMIAEEASNYNRKQFVVKSPGLLNSSFVNNIENKWNIISRKIFTKCKTKGLDNPAFYKLSSPGASSINSKLLKRDYEQQFFDQFLPERLDSFRLRLIDNLSVTNDLVASALEDKGNFLARILQNEFAKDNLSRRENVFKQRLYDRTVHPTQMFSLKAELLFEKLAGRIIKNQDIPDQLLNKITNELINEFLGLNVAIVSAEEPEELLLDLNSIITAENFSLLHSDFHFQSFLSFWGDWDGSARPSGQGHSLVAAVLIENVDRQSRLLRTLLATDKSVKIDSALLTEIERLPYSRVNFTNLLTQITQLTHQLEKRYRGTLPFNLKPGRIRQVGMKLKLAQDPLTSLWHHNDRLERRMIELRIQRKNAIEYFFSLNKKLRKTLNSQLSSFQKNIKDRELVTEACLYRDLLKRFVVTPRIHQKMITGQDQFAIDTTVHNINEINEISGKYGNPGMVMALQVSMSSKPEALISLNRKMRISREEILRDNPDMQIPSVWLVPLFEDFDAVKKMGGYLNKIWEYSLQSRRLNQETGNRFTEIICEVFVAGSDLSQQVGQAAGMNLFKEAKFNLTSWLAEKGLIGKVRMKMGSGEPMQRQGGYYSPVVGKPAFINSPGSVKRFSAYLKESTKKSTEYAATPLLGVFSGGDLRTFQSSISEKLRYLPVQEFAQLLYHLTESQKFYENEIARAGEPLSETRLQFKTRGLKELERLTLGSKDTLYEEFLGMLTLNFRQILYGNEEDVVGIHLISYFIARTTPSLRDRPTVRPGTSASGNTGERILGKIAETIPFSRYNSLLRAIAHNQSQTVVLGINQLTTGLFRALDSFSQKRFSEGDSEALIEDRVLPNLPVYEILHTLRLYHDNGLVYLNKLEKAFHAGNSAFVALREDIDSLNKYLVLFQRELLRRHGIEVSDFFESDKFIPDLLPALRPDLAILFQTDFFNTDPDKFFQLIKGDYSKEWSDEIISLLKLPDEIKYWRAKIWDLLEDRVFSRVESFVELATALYSLSLNNNSKELNFSPKNLKMPTDLSKYFGTSGDDNMQQFLAAAFEYLAVVSEGMAEVPINIVRAMNEVEKIVKIEEQALSPKEQDLLRFYLLQIARLTGENG